MPGLLCDEELNSEGQIRVIPVSRKDSDERLLDSTVIQAHEGVVTRRNS